MNPNLSIRLFRPTDEEYAAVAAIAAHFADEELVDFEYADAGDLRAFDASFIGTAHPLRRLVAVVGGVIVGYAQLFHVPWLREPGRFWAALRVAPAYQRRGIGGRLYRSTIEELFPKFNAEESALAAHLEPRQQDDLAAMLRSLLRAVTPSERDRPGPVA